MHDVIDNEFVILDAAIASVPPAYERLAGNAEWNTPRWTFLREITGYLAHWAVRQIGCNQSHDKTPFPPKLENVIGYLDACIRSRFDQLEVAKLSLCDTNRLLHDILMPEKFFLAGTTRRCLSTGSTWTP